MRLVVWSAVASLSACTPFNAAPSDGGVVTDAKVEDATPPSPPATTSALCADAGPALLCDDFERDVVLGPGWMDIQATDGSTLVLDDTQSTTPRRSLRADMGKSDSTAALRLPTPAHARRFDLGFSMRLTGSPNTIAQVAALDFEGRYRIMLLWKPNENVLGIGEQEYPTGGDYFYADKAIGAPPFGVFVRYRLVVDVDAHAATVTTSEASLGGTLTLTRPIRDAAYYMLGNAFTSSPPAAFSIWFDDVVVR